MKIQANYIITLCLLSLMTVTFSCEENRGVGCGRSQNIANLKTVEMSFSIDSLSLGLDSNTVNIVHYCQFIPDFDGKECLSFLNENTNSIYFYDIHTKDIIHTIDLRDLGLNKPVQGFLYSDKKVYAYSYPDASLTCIGLDSCQILFSEILYNNSFDRRNPFFVPKPFPQTSMPIRRIGDTLVLSGLVAGESSLENSENRPVITLLDTGAKELTHIINYPSVYQNANWGGGLSYRSAYYDTNANNDLVVSFPACDEIVEYSISDGSSRFHYAGSSKLGKIHPYASNKNIYGDSDKLWEWYLNNPSYENLLYDEYRHCYYRFAKLPQKSDYNSKIGTQKPTIIVVLDDSFEYLGEFSLPSSIMTVTTNAFVSNSGIYIQKKEQNEDLISFYIICLDQ